MKTEKIVCQTVHTLSKDENLELEHNRTSLTAAWVQKAYFLGLRGWNSSKGEKKTCLESSEVWRSRNQDDSQHVFGPKLDFFGSDMTADNRYFPRDLLIKILSILPITFSTLDFSAFY